MLIGLVAVLSALAAVGICACTGSFDTQAWLWVLPVSFLGSVLLLALVAFLLLWLICACVDMKKPQEKDSRFYRRVMLLYIDALVVIMGLRLEIRGLEMLPKSGRYLLVCNHLSIADPAILLAVFRKSQLAFITKRENEQMFLVNKFQHKILCQSINRENDREALKTILKCIRLIRDDLVSVGVFPEGYVSESGKLLPFRNGVFKIAQKTNVPIVVCTLKNTPDLFRNAPRLKPTHIPVHLVGVIEAEQLQGRTTVDIGNQVYEMMIGDMGADFRYEEIDT